MFNNPLTGTRIVPEKVQVKGFKAPCALPKIVARQFSGTDPFEREARGELLLLWCRHFTNESIFVSVTAGQAES